MNLSKLFELQKALDAPYRHVEDRLSKDILWLMEELGELASEWRGHKYRSPEEDQEPRTDEPVPCSCVAGYYLNEEKGYGWITCTECEGERYNPLLEEYTDCLSIILSIGLQLNADEWDLQQYLVPFIPYDNVTDHFIDMMNYANMRGIDETDSDYEIYKAVFEMFMGLGLNLGFTWEQIETNYIQKAEVNAKRNC